MINDGLANRGTKQDTAVPYGSQLRGILNVGRLRHGDQLGTQGREQAATRSRGLAASASSTAYTRPTGAAVAWLRR